MYNNLNHGYITLVTGPMYAGKSEELLKIIRRLQYGEVSHQIFKPSVDSRDQAFIKSRSVYSILLPWDRILSNI